MDAPKKDEYFPNCLCGKQFKNPESVESIDRRIKRNLHVETGWILVNFGVFVDNNKFFATILPNVRNSASARP